MFAEVLSTLHQLYQLSLLLSQQGEIASTSYSTITSSDSCKVPRVACAHTDKAVPTFDSEVWAVCETISATVGIQTILSAVL